MKNFVVILVIVIFGLVAALISIDTTQGQQNVPTQESKTDEPTVVNIGEFTEKEKAYSKYYRKIYGDVNTKNLTEVNQPDGFGRVISAGNEPSSPNQPEKSDIEFFTEMSCQADVIVVGKVDDKKSHLTDDETFVFTSYNFLVKRIVKDNQNKSLDENDVIEVTRPGGFIKIKNQLIKFIDGSFAPLEKGKKYLLFLKYIPEADGYVVANSRSDFRITDTGEYESIARTKHPKNLKEGNSTDILISEIQSSFVSDCSQYKSGGE